jgi:tyrosyl-tRNA synthetase
MNEIARLATLKGNEINDAKKILATEATALVHGRIAADQAAETARKTFEEGATSLSLPTIPVSQKDLSAGIGVLNAFVLAGLAASNGEVRRAIGNGAVAVNDARITSDKHDLQKDITPDGVTSRHLAKTARAAETALISAKANKI